MTSRLLSALLLASLIGPAWADRYQGKVVKVLDGDTLTVDTGLNKQRVVRLYGIDCPEGDQPFSNEARAFAVSQCLEKQVRIHVKQGDRAGRIVSLVLLPDGRDLSLVMVEAGWAWCSSRHGVVPEAFKGAESLARKTRHGLWRKANPVPPWKWRQRVKPAVPFADSAQTGTITEVRDGDTLKFRRKGKKEKDVAIRLYGMDCPEGGRPFTEAAREFVEKACLERMVTVKPTAPPDRYGRMIARIILSDGRDLSLSLVEAGLAWWDPKAAPDDEPLQEAQKRARKARVGLWQDDDPKPPWEK